MAERWTDRLALDDVDRALALALQEDSQTSYAKRAEWAASGELDG